MLAVARALLPEPRLLLLDEPTMGLGPAVVEVLYAALRRVISEHATTVVWVEQQAIRARDLAHQVVLLERGRMVMSGDPAMFSDDRLLKRTYLGG
jgi:branched-chain amino acid transport system ATP-binding protein